MNRNEQSATRTPGYRHGWVISLCLAFLLSLNALDAQAAQQIVYYHTDALGSPVAATDEAGAVIWREEYLPYGQRIYRDPATVKNDRWFTGHPHEEDVGLTYMGARWYDPVVGRFMGVDLQSFSEQDPHSFNRYVYGNNNPYKYVDPNGQWVVGAIMWGVGAWLTYHELSQPPSLDAHHDSAIDTIATYPGPVGGVGAGVKVGASVGKGLERVANKVDAQNIANASKLAKQLSSEEGATELLSGGGKAIVGAGTSVPIRDVGRLVSEYGGKPGDWAKITSTAERHLQTHAYRNAVTGEVVELKSIVP